jgi:hypothetical protein
MKLNRKWTTSSIAFLAIAALLWPAIASAETLTTNVLLTVKGHQTSVGDLGTATVEPELKSALALTSGVGANQADKIFADTRTIAASTTEDLDVSAGGLLDQLGGTFTIVKLKVFAVCAASTNTNNVVLLGDANSVPILSTAATTITIHPNSCVVLADPSLAGYAVTNATGDVIQVANSGAGTSVTYSIVLIGTSS